MTPSQFGAYHRVASLVRYVDTYRDPNADAEGEEELEEGSGKRRPWYAFWRAGKSEQSRGKLSDFETPSDWLNTDVGHGLEPAEVERRRKYSGWNELTTEKENMLLKFIGFFRGPILYGRQQKRPRPPHTRKSD